MSEFKNKRLGDMITLNHLSPKVQEKAVLNMVMKFIKSDINIPTNSIMSTTLLGAFNWESSPEGFDYWDEAFEEAAKELYNRVLNLY
jgi:hypothetical protein